MRRRITIRLETPFDDEESSMKWLDDLVPAINGDVSITCGDVTESFNQTVRKRSKSSG